jgi:transcriptional regulator with XRE-family HTH domain
MNLSENLKKLRESRKLTQEKLAEKINMSQNGYSKIERSPENAPLFRLQQIAEALDIPLVELINVDANKGIHISNSNHDQSTAFFNNSQSPVNDVKETFEAQIALLCAQFQARIDNLASDVAYYRGIFEKKLPQSL